VSAGLLRDICFNVAHWWFACEYYSSAIAMPFIFNHEELPEDKKTSLDKLYRFVLYLNICLPIPYYAVLAYINLTPKWDN
jgi:hypothetical protein